MKSFKKKKNSSIIESERHFVDFILLVYRELLNMRKLTQQQLYFFGSEQPNPNLIMKLDLENDPHEEIKQVVCGLNHIWLVLGLEDFCLSCSH